MIKKINFILFFLFLFSTTNKVYAENFEKPDLRVIWNEKVLELNTKPEIINNTAYIPAREVFEYLGAGVHWNLLNKQVIVRHHGKSYKVKNIIKDETAMVEASALKSIFGYNISYSKEYNVVLIDAGDEQYNNKIPNILPTYCNYSREDLFWLSKIVHAEARGEDYASKLAVANVILNRVNSRTYPNTIKEVIFDNKFGVQFTPTANGAVYNEPSAESFLAAVEALEGKNNAKDTLFFINPRQAKSDWVINNRSFAFAMGNHNFYY